MDNISSAAPAATVASDVTAVENAVTTAIVAEAGALGGAPAATVAAAITPAAIGVLAKALADLYAHIGKPLEAEFSALLASL